MIKTKEDAQRLLEQYVEDDYQKLHAQMVACALEGYAIKNNKSEDEVFLYWLTGYLHDIDFYKFPTSHPKESLQWFKDWGLSDELIHAIEAHALGFNGFTTEPETDLAKLLIACDEICGIFYAYKRLNPISYSEIKVKSIKKKIKDKGFAPNIDRQHILDAVDRIENLTLEEHIENLISFLGKLD
ncbi:MAG: HD domain-containing protein [Nanoarchaeota archaeon]|nr:HD domain-containing protein [Nanoarchaeota archaeon]